MGLADSVIPKGAAEQLLPRLAPNGRLGLAAARGSSTCSRSCTARGATLSPAARLMIELATSRIQAIADPVRPVTVS